MTNEEAIEWLKVEYENARCDECIEDEYVNALEMAINALEIIKDFERAQIITGGRLNGKTHAYKCGLADGQRLANGEKLLNILPLKQTDKIEKSNFSTKQYKADLQSAYDCGYAKALEQTDILDKIKAEILDEAEYAYADFDRYKEDILYAEPDELPDDDFRYGMERAVEIINKYRKGDAE